MRTGFVAPGGIDQPRHRWIWRWIVTCLVTGGEIVVLELNRQERITQALRDRATGRSEYCIDVPVYPSCDERRRVLAADTGIASVEVEIESADPLGVWACGYPRQPRCWPTWRMVADWAAWSLFCLLAIAYAAIR